MGRNQPPRQQTVHLALVYQHLASMERFMEELHHQVLTLADPSSLRALSPQHLQLGDLSGLLVRQLAISRLGVRKRRRIHSKAR